MTLLDHYAHCCNYSLSFSVPSHLRDSFLLDPFQCKSQVSLQSWSPATNSAQIYVGAWATFSRFSCEGVLKHSILQTPLPFSASLRQVFPAKFQPAKGENIISSSALSFNSRVGLEVLSPRNPATLRSSRLQSAVAEAVDGGTIAALAEAMDLPFSSYGLMAVALAGVAVVAVSAASIFAIGVVLQPRWLLKIVRKQMPHIVFDHVTSELMVALTIDDGPNGETTHQLLDLLQEWDARATFFLIGQNMDKYPELVDRMHAEGHELGNHTMEDVASWRLSKHEFEDSLLQTEARLHQFFRRDKDGIPIKWFRPGHGWYTKGIRRTIQRHGYRLALGSVYPLDPLFKEKGGPIATYCLWKVYPGAIMVLHDRPQQLNQTIEILSKLLPELKQRGYKVVSLTELFESHSNPTTALLVRNKGWIAGGSRVLLQPHRPQRRSRSSGPTTS